MIPAELQQLWKEVTNSHVKEENCVPNNGHRGLDLSSPSPVPPKNHNQHGSTNGQYISHSLKREEERRHMWDYLYSVISSSWHHWGIIAPVKGGNPFKGSQIDGQVPTGHFLHMNINLSLLSTLAFSLRTRPVCLVLFIRDFQLNTWENALLERLVYCNDIKYLL